MYKKVVKIRSNHKKSSTCGDSTGSNWIEMRMGKKEQCDLVCGAPLNDWAMMLVYVDVLCTCT